MARATMAAAPVMKPSSMTKVSTRGCAEDRPVRAAISNPPKAASVLMGSVWGWRARARRIISIFRERPGSSRPGAAAGGFRGIEAREGAEEGGGGCGVANSHFACAKNFGLRGIGEPSVEGLLGFGAGHGGLASEIAGGTADAHIDDDGFDSAVAAQYVNRGASGTVVRDHLARDFGGIGADAFFDDAVISAEDDHRFARDLRRLSLLDQA